jgi:hypothetical protein
VKTIRHHDELHQIIIRGRASRLDNEDVLTANVILYLYAYFTITESGNFRITQFDSQPVSYPTGKNSVRITREDF